MTRARLLLAILGILAWLLAGQATAQQPAPAEAGLAGSSLAELQSLVQTIEDPAAREKLVGQLKALIAAQARLREADAAPERSTVGFLSERLAYASQTFVNAAQIVRDAPKIVGWIDQQIDDPAAVERWKMILLQLAVGIAAGFVLEWIVRAVLARPRRALMPSSAEAWYTRVLLIFGALLFDLLPIAAFAIGAYGALTLVGAAAVARIVALTVINAYLVARVVLILTKWVLVPPVPARRRWMSEETAYYLHIWVRRFILVGAIGFFTAQALRLLGLPLAGHLALLKLLGLVLLAMAVILILQNRDGVARTIAGANDDRPRRLGMLRRRLGDIWHVLAIVYLVGLYAVWALEIREGFPYVVRGTVMTAVAILVATALNATITRASARFFAIRDDVKLRFPELEARANRYVPIVETVLQALVWIGAALVIFAAWGADVAGWLEEGFGRRVLNAVFTIGIVCLIAIFLWEASSAAIERYLTRKDATGKPLPRSSRVRSLLPVLRNVVFVVLSTMVVLIALSEFGVNIAPLLAGAGVVGLAVGFGSQALVKDVITGAFILFEDSIAVGDIVKAGNYGGLVESMSIRSMRLRDFNGNLHTIPFGAVNEITNMTKEFSYYVFDVGVAYREDTDQVSQVLRDIGAEMQADPEFGAKILAPIEVVGVDAFTDSAVIVKARIKTAPIQQWSVGRELNRRIKKRFDELGIEIPFPHTTIYFGEDKQGKAPPARIELRRAAPPTEAHRPT